MTDIISKAEAYRLAQARTISTAKKAGVKLNLDNDGKVIPSDEALEFISKNHNVGDMITVKMETKPEEVVTFPRVNMIMEQDDTVYIPVVEIETDKPVHS